MSDAEDSRPKDSFEILADELARMGSAAGRC